MILLYTLILPILQLETQVMTSEITSHVEYLIQTYIFMFIVW